MSAPLAIPHHRARLIATIPGVTQNRIHIVAALLAGGLVLAACSAGSPAEAETDGPRDLAASDSPESSGPDYVAAVRARFADCEAIGATVTPYVAGLVSTPSDRFDPSRVYCTWGSPGSSDAGGSRGVEILIEPGNGVVATASAATTGLEMIPDEQIESLGGLAYSMSVSTAGTAFSATKVELPQVSVSITVGGSGAQSTPSGPAAVEITKKLLGL